MTRTGFLAHLAFAALLVCAAGWFFERTLSGLIQCRAERVCPW